MRGQVNREHSCRLTPDFVDTSKAPFEMKSPRFRVEDDPAGGDVDGALHPDHRGGQFESASAILLSASRLGAPWAVQTPGRAQPHAGRRLPGSTDTDFQPHTPEIFGVRSDDSRPGNAQARYGGCRHLMPVLAVSTEARNPERAVLAPGRPLPRAQRSWFAEQRPERPQEMPILRRQRHTRGSSHMTVSGFSGVKSRAWRGLKNPRLA